MPYAFAEGGPIQGCFQLPGGQTTTTTTTTTPTTTTTEEPQTTTTADPCEDAAWPGPDGPPIIPDGYVAQTYAESYAQSGDASKYAFDPDGYAISFTDMDCDTTWVYPTVTCIGVGEGQRDRNIYNTNDTLAVPGVYTYSVSRYNCDGCPISTTFTLTLVRIENPVECVDPQGEGLVKQMSFTARYRSNDTVYPGSTCPADGVVVDCTIDPDYPMSMCEVTRTAVLTTLTRSDLCDCFTGTVSLAGPAGSGPIVFLLMYCPQTSLDQAPGQYGGWSINWGIPQGGSGIDGWSGFGSHSIPITLGSCQGFSGYQIGFDLVV